MGVCSVCPVYPVRYWKLLLRTNSLNLVVLASDDLACLDILLSSFCLSVCLFSFSFLHLIFFPSSLLTRPSPPLPSPPLPFSPLFSLPLSPSLPSPHPPLLFFIDKILPRRHYMTCPLSGSAPQGCSVPLPFS